MSKDLTDAQVGRSRKWRVDRGGKHRSKKYKDMVLRQYLLNGEFVREWSAIEDAVESSGGKLTYGGIYNVIKGTQFQHGGFLWRSDKGSGRGLLDGAVDAGEVGRNAVEWLKAQGGALKSVRIEATLEGGAVRTYEYRYNAPGEPLEI